MYFKRKYKKKDKDTYRVYFQNKTRSYVIFNIIITMLLRT